jgi:hypothetical protein
LLAPSLGRGGHGAILRPPAGGASLPNNRRSGRATEELMREASLINACRSTVHGALAHPG